MSDIVLEMRRVTKRFPGVVALDNVSLQLHKGEVLGIVGENGAGKSTLMKVLSGSYLHGEYEGELFIDGKEVHFSSVEEAQHQGIEMVYQEMNMMLDASIAENLFVGNLPTRNGFINFKKLYGDVQTILDNLKLLLEPQMMVRNLNSGQMQLLSLMRASVKNPRILVLDEPTTALTDSEVDVLMNHISKLCEAGTSCIYISHKLEEIFRICDRVLVMRDGKTISCKPVQEVLQQTLIEEMVGRKVENLYPKQNHAEEEEVFRVEQLTVPHPNIRGKNIVQEISFSLKKGEILGIGGLVGAGRSEILGAIFGQYSRGVKKKIFIRKKETTIHTPMDAIRAGLGYITEERKLNGIIWMLNVRENMALASLRKLSGRIFVKRKYEKKVTAQLFEKLRIKAPSLETKLVELSGGNQQKVILGKWLLNNPTILLIDEPTKGIDVGTKADFYQIMSELTREGVSIIMVSSDMPELIAMSDRCLVIAEGRVSAELHKPYINEISIMKAAIS